MSIEEIRSRLEAATPGPWEKDAHGIAKLDSIVFKAYSDKPGGWIEVARSYGADTEFIAAAPEDVRRLLNALEAVEEWMKNLDAVERVKLTDPYDLRCYQDVARHVRAAIKSALEAKS